jgi:hypothetical protein
MAKVNFKKTEKLPGNFEAYANQYIYSGTEKDWKGEDKVELKCHGNGKYTRTVTVLMSVVENMCTLIGYKGKIVITQEITLSQNKLESTIKTPTGLEGYLSFEEKFVCCQKGKDVEFTFIVTGTNKVNAILAKTVEDTYTTMRLDKIRREITSSSPTFGTQLEGVDLPQ